MAEDKKRYRIKIINSRDCLTYVTFPDLSIKYGNGWSEPIKVREGNEIPLSALEPEDVRKSWIAGSLKRYTDTGWIEEIPEEIKPKPLTPIELAAIKAATPIQGTGTIAVPPPPIVSIKAEENKVNPNLPEAQSTLSNFSLVKSYEDFSKLSYFLKLRFIKETSNKDLLQEILQKTDSHQFKNNIQVRLAK
jgi:hypothetical protein